MVVYDHIDLNVKLPAGELLKLTKILEDLPLIFQGAHIEGDYCASEKNPAIVEILAKGEREFSLQPVKGDKIICYLKLPQMEFFPGCMTDPRPVLKVNSRFEQENYRINIFPRAIAD